MRSRVEAVALAAALLSGCGGQEPARVGHRTQTFAQQLRPTQAGALWAYDSGVELHSHDSPGGRFKVWYTLETSDAVPSLDADSSGVPDFVELVATIFDEVYVYEVETLGFRAPLTDTGLSLADDGGDDRFDVYLVDFGLSADGTFGADACLRDQAKCAGHMELENDFAGYGYPSREYAVRVLASHEFFHAIQAAYDAEQSTWWSEGTAMWAEEMYYPAQSDFEVRLDGYLDETDRSLDVPPVGPVDSFSYGQGIWPMFLTERYDDDTVRLVWEGLEDGAGGVDDPEPLGAIDRVLAAQHGASFAEAFTDFAAWNLLTGPFADPARAYASGDAYPKVETAPVSLPFQDTLRVFHASAQFYRARIGDRAELSAGFEVVEGEAAPADLRLGIALEQGAERTTPVWVDDLDAVHLEAVTTAGYEYAVVVVVNVAMSGNSLKPTLCVGSPDEALACRYPNGPPVEEEDPPGSGGDAPPPEDKGWGCAAAAPESAPLAWGVLLWGVWWRRRGGA